MRVSIMHFWISISHKQFQLTALFSYWHVTSKIWIFYIASPCASNLCNEISYCFKIYEIPETSLSLSQRTELNILHYLINLFMFLLRRFSLYFNKHTVFIEYVFFPFICMLRWWTDSLTKKIKQQHKNRLQLKQ